VIKKEDGQQITLPFDQVLVGIGRELNYEELDLEKAGIDTQKHGLVVNEYLETTNPDVYVCGDIAGSLKFSHAAEQQATMLLNNFLSPLRKSSTIRTCRGSLSPTRK
jgi:pyruvate/2-oxoglutarate dehydrogenase complex dihydrolipoamide dehydrogenase (E3) component